MNGLPVSLQEIPPGQVVRLVQVDGGKGMKQRLAEMGLFPGTEFKVIERGRPGPFIIEVRGGKLVLGQGMISRIFVAYVKG